MKLQYAPFLLPVWADNPEQEALNRFIRGRRVIQTKKELITLEGQPHWAILVEYIEGQNPGPQEPVKNKVDYREILSAEDFAIFSKLRDIRKRLAEENGLPVYAISTNEQLAEIAKRK
jgi:hypothetical protein